MSKKIWIGGIYLKEEGGYKIILKSLIHYKKRLQTIHQSPELKEAAAMFAPVLQSQAKIRIPIIEETKEKIEKFLLNLITSQSMEENLEILHKALECRKSDIEKAQNTSDPYFIKLVGDVEESKKDVQFIDNSLIKINEYLE
ncbi:MAG: hypothetical protein O2834_01855 [Crenarchaeota archaeon]|nr:hypothetical protein [Thermoproteota archaeon]HJJ21951.1 hypothetical protein [Nitrosopumilus sp.]MDA0852997.1 hypothetical protein [Thermoproteota archaeon]MDA1122961.1 hypothetical protein [Thermoproteota archaeon]HJJ24946.1 hypothetical protein [Nitrosopumilus sp.]